MLGIEPESSGRAAGTLNCWAIFPTHLKVTLSSKIFLCPELKKNQQVYGMLYLRRHMVIQFIKPRYQERASKWNMTLSDSFKVSTRRTSCGKRLCLSIAQVNNSVHIYLRGMEFRLGPEWPRSVQILKAGAGSLKESASRMGLAGIRFSCVVQPFSPHEEEILSSFTYWSLFPPKLKSPERSNQGRVL